MNKIGKNNLSPKIVIIDSGVNLKHPKFKDENFQGTSYIDTVYQGKECLFDKIGHGTAILGIIRQHCPNAQVYIIKIFDDKNNVSNENIIIKVLNDIYSNISCDIINLSLGINMIEKKNQFYEICKKLDEKGVILVSAYDNFNSISFPAEFDKVIGVSSSELFNKNNEIEYVESDKVNILANGCTQRVYWSNPDYSISGGNSFACAHVTGILANNFEIGMNRIKALQILKKLAKNKVNITSEFKEKINLPQINKAVIFPFNKEMHSLIRFQHLLDFEIEEIYDFRISGRVNATTNHLLKTNVKNYQIKNIDNIDFDKFDTLIIGHMDKIIKIKEDANFREQLIEKCLLKGKNIYSFDYLPKYYYREGFYYPKLEKYNIPDVFFGKLYRCPLPVIGVFGTSSKQGKFTLQLNLRDKFIQKGYNVGQIGSEPTAPLFGIDYCFHYGYNSNNEIIRFDTVKYINYCMNKLSDAKKDIILVGGQSSTICYDNGNISDFAFPQYEFLMSVCPDAVVLCINSFDCYEDIKRTIQFIESATNGKVISLVVFPLGLRNPNAGVYSERIRLKKEDFNKIREDFNIKFNLPIFFLGEDEDMKELTEICINFFS